MTMKNFDECVFQDYLAGQKALLPELPDVEKVSSRVTRILGGNPGQFQLQGTNTYLVGSGSDKILIDTAQGEPEWIKWVTQTLHREGFRITNCLLTHWHWDHTGGVPELIEHYPALSSAVYKNDPDGSQLPIENGQTFHVEGATIRAVFTPGHSNDHMCFVLEEENALFTGDNVLGHGFTLVEDLGLYASSLRIMQNQKCGIGYPGHGDVITDLPAKIDQYILQQARRESQIIAAMKQARDRLRRAGTTAEVGMTVKEIVLASFGAVGEDVSKSALEPCVNEILLKLAQEKKVGFKFSHGAKRWFLSPLA